METSYLKAHPFVNRYPEWMPNLFLDLNLCTWGYLGPQSTHGSTVPRQPNAKNVKILCFEGCCYDSCGN